MGKAKKPPLPGFPNEYCALQGFCTLPSIYGPKGMALFSLFQQRVNNLYDTNTCSLIVIFPNCLSIFILGFARVCYMLMIAKLFCPATLKS